VFYHFEPNSDFAIRCTLYAFFVIALPVHSKDMLFFNLKVVKELTALEQQVTVSKKELTSTNHYLLSAM
jgi:hypothetical protein